MHSIKVGAPAQFLKTKERKTYFANPLNTKTHRTFVFLLLLMMVLAVNLRSARGETHTPETTQAALDFAFSGLKLGMTMDEVKALGATLIPELPKSDPEAMYLKFTVVGFKELDVLMLSFYNGKLYQIGVGYNPDTIEKMGGWHTLYHRLVAKLGHPEESEDSVETKKRPTWQFTQINRRFVLIASSPSVAIILSDLAVVAEMAKLRESRAKVGF